MSMLPVVSNQVRPWFEAYGAALTDRFSFRFMIGAAERDILSLEKLMPQYRAYALDVAAECDAELDSARRLVSQMHDRLSALAVSSTQSNSGAK